MARVRYVWPLRQKVVARVVARVIIRVRIVDDELQLLYIYDKADMGNINDSYLRDLLKRME